MISLRPVAETDETVTLRRADYEALLEALEDATDVASAHAAEARVEAGSSEFLPIAMVEQLLAGASPVRLWRQHRGMSAHTLARTAEISPSYLSEIEARKRRGSLAVAARIAAALRVSLDDLVKPWPGKAKRSS
jgi:DNA-binding XRE family transcriptional regulator